MIHQNTKGSMAGRLIDARSTLDDLLKQLADKQESLRYFYIKEILDTFYLVQGAFRAQKCEDLRRRVTCVLA